MPTSHEQNHHPDPADVFLDTEALAQRWDIGTTKVKAMAKAGLLPASVVPGMVRIPLVAIRAWELASSLAGTAADPARNDHVTVLAPPAARPAGRAGRKAVA